MTFLGSTRLTSNPKIKPWVDVLKEIIETIENQNERHNSITIPYGLQIENELWNPEELRVAIHVTSSSAGDCFLSHNGVGKNNKLNIWTITTAKDTNVTKTDLKTFPTSFKFKQFLFITKRWIYISYSMDMTIHVFSAKFIPISSAFAGRTILSLEYNKTRDEILAGIAGGIIIWNFPVKQTDQLIPGQIINCTFSPDEWTIDLKVDPVWNQIVVISKEKIAVLETMNYKCQISFARNTEVFLTSCVLYNPMNYFIVGDQSGMIKVMSSSLASLPQVAQLLGHCDAITSLVTHLHEPLLISGSRDKTIRIWNFDTLTQTYCLQTGEEILHLDLISSSKLYYRSKHSIKVWHMNLFHNLFATLSSKIIRIIRVESPEYPARILVQSIDGGIRLISPVTGCQLSAMLPITTLSSSIVDVCHDRRKELLYIALDNREVLVFESDSNPCCASQLWQADYTDEGVCSIALMNAENALGEEDLELEFGLLFAGHYNGQISLLDGHGVEMKKNVQAHQGQIIRLCSSYGHNVPNDTLEARDHLVSLGKDSVIRVWVVRHVVQMAIRIELKCEVRLLSIPTDIAMIGNILCLTMSDFRVVMARVKVKSKGIFTKDKPCDFLFHSKDEGHTAAINGLSSCPHLKLFATSSEDQSIKLWNIKNQLVRELNFDDTLCGVCFANHRGDLLVGFQSHISLVVLTNYLPGTYLEKVSSMHFENDPVERYVHFDDHLQFWYDPKLVPTLPMDLSQRRPLLPPEQTPHPWEEESDSGTEDISIRPVVENDGLNWLRNASQRVNMSSRASMSSRLSFMSRGDQEEGRLTSSGLFGSKASSLMDAQGKNLHDLDSVLSLLRTSHLGANLSRTCLEDLVRSRDEQKALLLPPHYWPCAPDCFIPNSVIRKYIKVRGPPTHMIPRLIRPEKQIKKKKERKTSDDIMEANKKALRRKIASSKKTRPVRKTPSKPEALPDEELKKVESMPLSSFSSPASTRAELRRRRRTLQASQPDAIFEEMSEGEEEEEEVEEEEEEQEQEEEPEDIPVVVDKEIESVMFEPEPYVIDYGERDEDYRFYSSTSEEEEEEEEEKKEEEIQEEKELPNPIKRIEDLEVKPKEQYRFTTKPPPESILQQVVRKPWYPTKRKAKTDVNVVVNNVMKVLNQGDLDVFDDVCTDVIRIHRAYGISTSKTSLLHDTLLKYTWHEDPKVRRKGIETLRHLMVKKKDTTLALISRIVDEDEDVREEAKSALRDLHEIYTMEDLTGTLLKLGVVSFQLPCNDNMVLSELMDRLRRIKELKRIQEQEKEKRREAKEEKKKRKYRLPVSKRRESQFARRRSIKPLPTDASPSDVDELRQELNETNLGCRLLQQLSPVSNILYTHFVGSLPSSSSRSTPEDVDLTVAGKSIGKTTPPEGISSSTEALPESFRQATIAGYSSSSLLPGLGGSSSTVVTATASRRHSKTLEAMLCSTEALRRHSLLRRASDVTSGVSGSLIPTRKGKIKGKGELTEKVTEEETDQLESDDEDDETKMSLDEFVEVLNEMKTHHVGRTLLLSLMHMKGKQPSKKRISFNIPDILNLISQLPAVLKQEKPAFNTMVSLLQGKVDEEQNAEKLTVKVKQSLLLQLFQIKSSLSDRDCQILEVDKTMKKYRAELNSKWTAENTSETCAVSIKDLMWILSVISNKEDRIFLIKNIIINALKELEHVKIAPQRALAVSSGLPEVGKQDELTYTAEGVKKSRRFAEDMKPSSTATAQRRDNQIRDIKVYNKTYKANKVSSVRHRISALRTPVRRSLVPGVHGERLAHSLDVNRPLPYKEIERLITEQIVRSLPYRLSFHTGASEYGLSKYGILEVTWTSRGPRYTISDVDIHGRAFKRDVTKYVSPEHLSRDNLRQFKNDVSKMKNCSGISHGEQRSSASQVDVPSDNKKMKNVYPVLRNRLQKPPNFLPMPGLTELGQTSSQQTGKPQGEGESTFCISDSYPTAPSNSPRVLSPNFSLPSLQTGKETLRSARESLTRDPFTSQVDEVFISSLPLVKGLNGTK